MVLEVCAGVDEYTRSAAVLTAYAESDFISGAAQKKSRGIYQQTPPWWPTWDQGPAAQCRAFVADFQAKQVQHTGRIVQDCWMTQMWAAPDPRHDLAGFLAAPETLNYVRRVADVPRIITERKLP